MSDSRPLTPQERADPYTYVGRGYALLLMVWAMGTPTVRHRDIETGRRTDPGVWLWLASVQFRTAEMLAAGEDPWAIAPPAHIPAPRRGCR